jgi:hypothetical protein
MELFASVKTRTPIYRMEFVLLKTPLVKRVNSSKTLFLVLAEIVHLWSMDSVLLVMVQKLKIVKDADKHNS